MFNAPLSLTTETAFELPSYLHESGAHNPWVVANLHGRDIHSFLEGPCFDAFDNLWVTDIPFGRIFRITPTGEWDLIRKGGAAARRTTIQLGSGSPENARSNHGNRADKVSRACTAVHRKLELPDAISRIAFHAQRGTSFHSQDWPTGTFNNRKRCFGKKERRRCSAHRAACPLMFVVLAPDSVDSYIPVYCTHQ